MKVYYDKDSNLDVIKEKKVNLTKQILMLLISLIL